MKCLSEAAHSQNGRHVHVFRGADILHGFPCISFMHSA
jgi:hypothetical protein